MGPNQSTIPPAALYKFLFPDDGTAAMLTDPTQQDIPYGTAPGVSPGASPALLAALGKQSVVMPPQPAPQIMGPMSQPQNGLAPIANAPVMPPMPTGADFSVAGPQQDDGDDDGTIPPSDVDDAADLTSGIGAPVSSSPQQSADDFGAMDDPGFAGDGGNGENAVVDPSDLDVLPSDQPGIGGADKSGNSGDPDADLRARMATMIKGVANAQPSASDKGLAIMMLAAGMGSGDPRTGLIGALGAGAKTAIPFYKSEEQQARQKAAQEADLGLKTESMVNAAGARRDRAKYQQGQLDVANRNAASGERRADAIEEWRKAQAGQGNFELTGTKKGADGNMYPVYTDKHNGTQKLGTVAVDQLKGAGAKTSATQLKHDLYVAVHPGDEQGALDYMAGHKAVSAPEAMRAATSLAKAQAAQEMDPSEAKNVFDSTYRSALRAAGFDPDKMGTAAPSAPAAAPKAASPKTAPKANAVPPADVPDGAVQSKNGKWYWKENGVLKSN